MTKPDLMAELAAYKRLCSTPGIDASFKYQAAANFMNHAELEAVVRDAARYRWLRDLPDGSPYEEIGNYPGDCWDEAIDQAMHNSAREG